LDSVTSGQTEFEAVTAARPMSDGIALDSLKNNKADSSVTRISFTETRIPALMCYSTHSRSAS